LSGGEKSLPWPEPRRLGRTPHSKTQVSQRFLKRLRRGRLRRAPLPAQTPESDGMGDPRLRLHFAPGFFSAPPFRAESRTLRAVGARHRAMMLRTAASIHVARPQGSGHVPCSLPPPENSWSWLSLRGFRGGFAPLKRDSPASRSLPPLSRRGAWKEERKGWPCRPLARHHEDTCLFEPGDDARIMCPTGFRFR
jgi:hypothetical protein